MIKNYYKKAAHTNYKQFAELASNILDIECKEMDLQNCVGKAREGIICEYSIQMAIGSMVTKKKYLLIGALSGIILSSIAFVGSKNIKEKKEKI